MTTTFDARRFELLHSERGISLRELGSETGIGLSVLNRVEQGTDPDATGLTLGQFIRIANYLAVDPATLLTTQAQASSSSHTLGIPGDTDYHAEDEPTPPSDDLTADVRLLGAILHDINTRIRITALAEVLNWTVRRVHAAADQLDLDLAPTGTRIHRIGGVINVRAIDDTHQDQLLAVRRHPEATAKYRITSPPRARFLHQILTTGKSTNTLSATDRRDLAILMRAGVLKQGRNKISVTDDLRKSLFPEEG